MTNYQKYETISRLQHIHIIHTDILNVNCSVFKRQYIIFLRSYCEYIFNVIFSCVYYDVLTILYDIILCHYIQGKNNIISTVYSLIVKARQGVEFFTILLNLFICEDFTQTYYRW